MVVIRSRGDNIGNFGFRNSEFLRSSMVEQVGGYEKLGSFYLGKEDDTEKSEITEDLLLDDSKDLVTQGGGAGNDRIWRDRAIYRSARGGDYG